MLPKGPPTLQLPQLVSGLCSALPRRPILFNKHVNITYKTLQLSNFSGAPEEYRKFFLITTCVLNKDTRKQRFKTPWKGSEDITTAPVWV